MRIDPNSLFDSDTEIGESSSESSDEEDPVTNDRKYYSNLSVEDDFLLVLMKLRLGLSTIDLAVRFNVSEATVSKLFTTWIKPQPFWGSPKDFRTRRFSYPMRNE